MANGGLTVGDPLPWFTCKTHQSSGFRVDTLAGSPVVLFAFGTSGHPAVRAGLEELLARKPALDESKVRLAGIAIDPADQPAQSFSERAVAPVFLDTDHAISRQLGLVAGEGSRIGYRPTCFVLDQRLRVAAILPLQGDGSLGQRVDQALEGVAQRDAVERPAPILVIPSVFEPPFCQELIALYEQHGGEQSGFMRSDKDGRTVHAFDPNHKKRRDYIVQEEPVRNAIRARLARRIVPEIRKAYQFEASRIERYLVACYAADEGGHFRAHRDNTTKGTAHRRFAVSINLDTDRHEGGDLRFPEFGRQTYRPPSGGAVVFSCSLLHEATSVTAGRRYCVLPFLYDDAAAKVREANLQFIEQREGG